MYPTRLRRLRHFTYTGERAYSLTFLTFEGRPYFRDEQVAGVVIAQILRAAHDCDYAVRAYCAMPDHFHAYVRGVAKDADLPKFVKRAKQLSGFHGKAHTGKQIWRVGYYERIVGLDEDEHVIMRYILENPVRARLVTRACEYPWSGSSVFTREDLFARFCPAEVTCTPGMPDL